MGLLNGIEWKALYHTIVAEAIFLASLEIP